MTAVDGVARARRGAPRAAAGGTRWWRWMAASAAVHPGGGLAHELLTRAGHPTGTGGSAA